MRLVSGPAAVAARQRRIGQKLELIKGEIAKLPAQMQQALPDVQRQGHAFDFQVAAIFQAGIDIPDIERRAKICQLALTWLTSTGTPVVDSILPAAADASCPDAAKRGAARSRATRQSRPALPL
jgi:hypothetical protein